MSVAQTATPAAPRVSIVLPFRDVARFLAEAVESVLAQSYRSWELLLVDDGASDGSSAIARGFSERHPEVVRHLVHEGHRNLGISVSRNRGVAESAGELIACLDGDDVWLPEKLERQVEWLDRHPTAAMTYGASLEWYSWSGRPEVIGRDRVYDLSFAAARLVEPPELVLPFVSETVGAPCPSSFLIRRSVWREVRGCEPSFRGMYEDQVLLMKIHLRYPVYVSEGWLERYRRRPDSIYSRAQRAGSVPRARLEFLDWLVRYLRQTAWRGQELDRAVRALRFRLRHPRLARALEAVRPRDIAAGAL